MGIITNDLDITNTVNKVVTRVTGVTEDLEDEIMNPGNGEDETPELARALSDGACFYKYDEVIVP